MGWTWVTAAVGSGLPAGGTAVTGKGVPVGAVEVPHATRMTIATRIKVRHCFVTGLILDHIPPQSLLTSNSGRPGEDHLGP